MSAAANPAVPLEVLYADEHLAIVSKPAGVVTQPGIDHADDTALNGLMHRWGPQLTRLGADRDFGLIHRLDRPTSGLLVVGLSPEGYDGIRAQFEARTVLKRYVAMVHGAPRPAEGVIRQALAVVRTEGRKRSVPSKGRGAKAAVTHYTVIARGRRAALVECRIETGRLHQIRAHLAHRRAPVVGDREYGTRTPLNDAFASALGRQAVFLHAGELGFAHPVTGGRLTVRVAVPPMLRAFLADEGVECPKAWRR